MEGDIQVDRTKLDWECVELHQKRKEKRTFV